MNGVEGRFASALTKCPCNYVYSGTKALYMVAPLVPKYFKDPIRIVLFSGAAAGAPPLSASKAPEQKPQSRPNQTFLPAWSRQENPTPVKG